MSREKNRLRQMVAARDQCICAECGADCDKIKRIYWRYLDEDAQAFYGDLIGYNGRAFWEADHILERAAGGADDLGNLQTLCTQCHRRKTNWFMRRRTMPEYFRCAEGCSDEDHVYALVRALDDHSVRIAIIDGMITFRVLRGFAEEFRHLFKPSVIAHKEHVRHFIGLCNEPDFEASLEC